MNLAKIVRKIWILPIEFYRIVISPALPDTCIYTPSCSSYGKKAILKHGILKGTLLAISRIGRCTGAFFTGGDDPVPDHFSFKEIGEGYRRFHRRKRP
ncbi:membrane protein insertion efficiency factor YidD [Sediminispirochaeta smaragdinae]|jgi:hypothetical protein|uniref:membrane protein insertion efficiency factor YidD n=1 Tax=Sediminispirochaeta smaragdinae TaxID=55206 RepID=UPI000A01813F|nr:membrane protein insertion efficiency factor YidD [Sediminispirochaeta smaragdinae]